MADQAAVDSAGNNSYWQQVELVYEDGTKIPAVLDLPTIKRLENGDTELLQEIRNNVKASDKNNNETVSKNTNDTVSTNSNGTVSRNNNEKTVSRNNNETVLINPATAASHEESSHIEDMPSTSQCQSYTSWPNEAILYLISLYEEYENKLEDPKQKKKDIWSEITTRMQEKGYEYSQNKVESKWRTLVQTHKDVCCNNKQTGKKRKSFRYFQELERILGKRHDINPVILAGSSLEVGTKKSYSAKIDKSESVQKKKRKNQTESGEPNIIEYLKEREEAREERYQEREKKKDERAKERNEILKEMLDCHISDLPKEILRQILMLVHVEDSYCQLYAVNKVFKVAYLIRSKFSVSISTLEDNSELLSGMPNLKQLKIYASDGDVTLMISCFEKTSLKKLTHLTIVNFHFRNHDFLRFVDCLHVCCFSLILLSFTSCQKVAITEIKYVLSKMPNLRYCDIDIQLKFSDNSIFEFAQMANCLAGKVNFHCNALELVPSELLVYPRSVYRAVYPTGQTI